LLGEFAASVAHEINQPLAAIVTNSGASMRWLAKDPPNLDEAKYAINRITRDANRASDVIKRLRALVTRKAPEYADVDLNNALDEALVFIHSDLRSANVLVDTELADGLPPVRGDRIQLQQVMLNLITNGIDAMKSVGDRPRVLHIKTRMAESGDVLLEVEDSGVGIDPATADHLFTHFFSTKAGGTGLGLAISKTIIEGHGGRLKANAASQHGAIFQFTVPRATAPSP
jgi:C4-dicarboxylate-specific signal transduction histidine kinase